MKNWNEWNKLLVAVLFVIVAGAYFLMQSGKFTFQQSNANYNMDIPSVPRGR